MTNKQNLHTVICLVTSNPILGNDCPVPQPINRSVMILMPRVCSELTSLAKHSQFGGQISLQNLLCKSFSLESVSQY